MKNFIFKNLKNRNTMLSPLKLIFYSAVMLSALLMFNQCGVSTEKPIHHSTGNNLHFISKENLNDLYLTSLLQSYHYMFDHNDGIEIEGTHVGKFIGGFKGIFLYSGFKDALHTYSGGEISLSNDFYDLTPYDQFSGEISLFQDSNNQFYSWDENDHEPFHYYNPEIVKWGYTNLIPDPNSLIGDKTAQQVYDAVMKRFFRLMVESHYLLHTGDLKIEVEQYQSQIGMANFEALEYLTQRYAGKLTQYEEVDEYSGLQPSYAIGFWLRREMDGSANEFWIGFSKVMDLYDQKWFSKFNK